MQKQQYKIYPSLLDAYNWYASSEQETAEQDFINKINRVKFESEAADKGTWFNELIDLSLKGLEKYDLLYLDGEAAKIALKLQGAARQVYTETVLQVDDAEVFLYGYADYVKEDVVTDLKTTKQYELGKYRNSMQRHFYPLSMTDNGCQISAFEFIVYDFDHSFTERFPFNYEESRAVLENACRGVIAFLSAKRELITDTKIFALDVPTL